MLKLKANFNIQNTIRDDLVTIDKTYFYKKIKEKGNNLMTILSNLNSYILQLLQRKRITSYPPFLDFDKCSSKIFIYT